MFSRSQNPPKKIRFRLPYFLRFAVILESISAPRTRSNFFEWFRISIPFSLLSLARPSLRTPSRNNPPLLSFEPENPLQRLQLLALLLV